MNTRSEDGKYIFSGYQDDTQPYQFDSSSGRYTYNGDQGQHSTIIGEGVSIKSSDNGFDTFEKVDARLNIESNTAAVSGFITAANVYVDGQTEFDKFHQANYNADPTALATANTYSVLVSPGATAAEPQTYEIYRDGAPQSPAITGEVTDDTIEYAGMTIEIEGSAPGQLDFTLKKPQKENILNTLESLVNSLKDTSSNSGSLQQTLDNSIVQLNNASEQVIFTQASLGGRMNAVDTVSASNLALNIQNKASRSNLVEVDMAEAISELTKQETALQASQATFGRLSNLSLFDYL
tara:strand:- start:252 stop:1133 length:882 start_codon:yes stop_codon:yes gene_type:complete